MRPRIFLLATTCLQAWATVAADSSCERLKATLTYTQEKAPRDLSSVLPVVVDKVNRVLDGVVDVEVEWSGAELHGRVGQHFVKSTVTRLASAVSNDGLEISLDDQGREVTRQCFHVPFTILDTNECNLPVGHPMKHRCPTPSQCVNTIGSYECICPPVPDNYNLVGFTADEEFWLILDASQRSPWELSFASSSQSSCPASASTYRCCPEGGHSPEGQKCRQRFHCPVDPCTTSDCADLAACVRAQNPTDFPNHTCQCPEGLMGNGRACKSSDPKPEPKVMFDGKTPTELTVKNNFYCGCTTPTVDACSGFPPCQGKHEICTVGAGNMPQCLCKSGYVKHEKYGCVDENPPTLKLRNDPKGDKTLRLQQGDEYREYMVDIVDENAEDYLRSLKVSYSQPLPNGCLTQVGEFHVNYTIAMPWAKDPFVRETRRVIIDDVDECKLDVSAYKQNCPALVPQCDAAAGAQCVNTLGSYQCKCPSHSAGDGFKHDAKFDGFPAPESYKGGTSCVDTSKPVITLRGPNPKIFKICECGGLTGVSSPTKSIGDVNTLLQGQRQTYEDDIKAMIRETAGAELCAVPSNPNPKPSDCIKAIDQTYKGKVDLSDRVVVGEPVQKSALQWSVPYNVKDDAGNVATTVWRDVVVQEVDLISFENVIRAEVVRELEVTHEKAIQKAIRDEKLKWERDQANSNRNRKPNSSMTCPACPPCDCPDLPATTKESCLQFCENVSKSCSLSDKSIVYALILSMESYLMPSIVPVVIAVVIFFLGWVVVLLCCSTVYNPRTYNNNPSSGYSFSNDDHLLRRPQPLGPSQTPQHQDFLSTFEAKNGSRGSDLSPRGQPGFASPSVLAGSRTPPNRPTDPVYDGNIYMSPPIITPSKTGDGVQRRNL